MNLFISQSQLQGHSRHPRPLFLQRLWIHLNFCLIYQEELWQKMQNNQKFSFFYTLTNSCSSLEICAGPTIPIDCFFSVVCCLEICCCWELGTGRELLEVWIGVFVVGLLVIVIEELICLFPRPAGRPLPGLLAFEEVVMVVLVGSSRSTAMMSFTELIMSFLLGCSCLTDKIHCF